LKRVLINGKFLKLQIWDVSGAERDSPLMKIFLKGALGVIFVFDASSEKSKMQLVKW
jgi:GTPase SAR1 family protein